MRPLPRLDHLARRARSQDIRVAEPPRLRPVIPTDALAAGGAPRGERAEGGDEGVRGPHSETRLFEAVFGALAGE